MSCVRHRLLLIGGMIGVLGFGRLVDFSSAAVSTDDQMMFDQGRYQPLLVQLKQELASNKMGVADRYRLLMLKGESLLRTKATDAAVDAFTAAAAVGADENAIAIAKANALLIKHSTGGKYQPKAKATGSKDLAPAIDIVDSAGRKPAFTAFFTDLVATLQPQVDRAQNSTSLSSILALAKQVGDARNVELAGSGADTQSKDMLTKLATSAGGLMKNVLKPMDAQIESVTKDAARQQKELGRRMKTNSFSSLSPDDVDTLDNVISAAGQVNTTAGQMTPIFGDIGDFKSIQTDAEKLVTDADKLLKQYHHSSAS